jgi:hypothetical protein
MIFFGLSLLRLYVVLKVIKYWNTYTNSRGQKIFEFFGNQRIWLFLYRTNLKINSFVTLVTIFLLFLILSAFLFKVLENYQQLESASPLGNIWNCFWFILQTMTTVGLGDYVPETLIARFMAVIVSIVGLLLQSLLMISITLFISIADENQGKAYAEINLLYTKEHHHNSYNIYFDNYIKYKFRKIKPQRNKSNSLPLLKGNNTKEVNKSTSFAPLENDNTIHNGTILNTTNNKLIGSNNLQIKLNNYVINQQQQTQKVNTLVQSQVIQNHHGLNKHNFTFYTLVDLFNKMKVIKEKYYLRVLSSMQIPITISDFCDFSKNKCEFQIEDTIEWYKERNDTFKSFIDFISENTQTFQQQLFDCFDKNIQILNLVLFIYLCGPIFTIEPSKQLRGDRIIKIKEMETKMREFHVKHYKKRINIPSSDKNVNSKQNNILFPTLMIDDHFIPNLQPNVHEKMDILYPNFASYSSDGSESDVFMEEEQSKNGSSHSS